MNTLRQPLLRELTTALLVALLLLQSATAVAPGPAWWSTQNVTDPSAVADDFAVANIGQLKHMAAKAAAAMDAELPGGAGAAIHALVDAWGDTLEAASKPGNGLAINQGQLKHVATPFYDRLGLPYPWAGSSALRDDYLLVNLGQLKHVFSFPLKFRTAGQGPTSIPPATLQAALDAWNALGDEDDKPLGSTAGDFDGDGIPNLQEYLMGHALFDPLDIDGDRIADAVEDAHPGILSKLNFADAVWDKEAGGAAAYYDLDWNVSYQGDGVMNYEEVLRLGLDPAATTTSTRTDGLTDAEVLVWTLNAGAPLALNADPLRTFWEGIDADWMDATANGSYLGWLDAGDANNDGEPDGLAEFRADMLDPLPVWEPWNPSVWAVQAPSPGSFFDPVTLSSVLMDWDEDGMADTDRDDDGLPDLWEYRYEFNLRDGEDRNHDADNDGLTNLEEYQLGTNPRLADTDGDGFDDHSESTGGGDPLVATIVPALSLSLVGSSHPYVFPGQTTPALAVKVTQGDLPVAGVTVVFNLGATAGRLLPAMHLAASPGVQMSVTTGADGVAAVTYAAGSKPGSASITATAPGITGSVEFGVTVVPVPQPFGAGGSDGGGGTYGNAAPARSTAAGAEATAAHIDDGFRIRVKQKGGAPAGPLPYVDQPPQFLPLSGVTLKPLGRVGYGDFSSLVVSWQWHTQLDFEPLPSSGPFKKTAVPSGIRQYLVLVYQATDVDGAGRVPKHVGVLRFQYTDKGGRQITLTGNIPEKFVKVQSSGDTQSVKFEPPPASKSEERVHTVLLPVEIKQPKENADGTFGDFVTVSELRPTRWRNMFRNGNESLIDDPDQIQVRIPGLRSSQETFMLRLGVSGITGKSNSISKDEDDVVAAWQANDVEVPPLHLVIDSTDDKFSGFAAESTTQKDDYVGDRTHIASLGATVELKIEGSETGDFPPIRIPVKGPDGKVEFRVFVLSPNGLSSGNQFDPINNEAKIAHEVYEQIGVSMDWLSTVTAPFPEGLPSSIPLNDPTHELTQDEVDTLVSLLPDPTDKSVIDVYYLPCQMKRPNGGTASGQFVRSLKPGKGKYGLVLISIQRNALVLAHELGHACNLGHQPVPNRPWWLMTDGGVIDTLGIYNSKRFHWQEEAIIKSTQNAYYIPLH